MVAAVRPWRLTNTARRLLPEVMAMMASESPPAMTLIEDVSFETTCRRKSAADLGPLAQ